jgi:GNAT superfamily N-acetyltransferase
MSITLPTMAERPDLRPRARELGAVWPPFMHHDPVANAYFPRVRDELPHFQFFAWNEERDEVVAEANAVPAAWDGDPESLPDEGLDAVLEGSFSERAPTPNVLCALQIVISSEYQGRGLSIRLIERMAEVARLHGFESLVAPVRPSLKHRYPLAPIERYVDWRRGDGTHLDPWLRTHERFGGRILRIAPRSMTIPGTIAEWEEWAGMVFPESGSYVVSGALEPVAVDREADRGVYVEPNVWMGHALGERGTITTRAA